LKLREQTRLPNTLSTSRTCYHSLFYSWKGNFLVILRSKDTSSYLNVLVIVVFDFFYYYYFFNSNEIFFGHLDILKRI
jgi:hypothetical protein